MAGSSAGSSVFAASAGVVPRVSSTVPSWESRLSFSWLGSRVSAGVSEITVPAPATDSSNMPVRLVMRTWVLESGVMNSLSAASGERIATPADGSMEPRISTLMVMPVAGLVTLTLSPGRYPTVFANSPVGRTPSSATTARPSRDGFDVAKVAEASKATISSEKINRLIIYPSLFLSFFRDGRVNHLGQLLAKGADSRG